MSKALIVLVCSLSVLASNVDAQIPSGSMTPPEFHAEKAAGIFNYDLTKVIDKLKVTDEDSQKKVAEALEVYNAKMNELSFAYASTFRELEDDFDKNVQIAMQRRDRSQMDGVKARIQEVIPPIKKEVNMEENALNEVMVVILTEKQNNKWLKYQKRKKQ